MGDTIYVVISLYECDIQVIAQDWGGAKERVMTGYRTSKRDITGFYSKMTS